MKPYAESVFSSVSLPDDQPPVVSIDKSKAARPLRSLRHYDKAIEAGRFRRARALAERAVHSAQLSNDIDNLGRAYLAELGFPLHQRLALVDEHAEISASLSDELDATAGRAADRLDTILTFMKHVGGKEDYLALVGAASELTVFLLAVHDGRADHTLVPSRIDQDWNRVDHEQNIHYGIDFIDTRHSDGTEIPVQVKTNISERKYADDILVINASQLVRGTGRTLRELQHALLRTITSDPNAQARAPRDYSPQERQDLFADDAALIQVATNRLYEHLDSYPAAQSLSESA